MKSPTFEEVEQARKLLGLGEYATLAEIKKAFRNRALNFHPDKCKDGDKSKCEEMMKKLNDAYKTLLAFCENYRYCFSQKTSEEEDWEDWKERFYDGFII